MINVVKGTHDIIQDEAFKYTAIEYFLKNLATAFGFTEFRTPIIEYSELFSRSVGDSSDIVRKEMYDFVDKGGRNITLRPEITAGVVRSIVENKLLQTNDNLIKAFYVGPCFRYERPQKGRYRQFHQFGIEVVGVDNYFRDLEVILFGYEVLKILGFDNLVLKINSLGDKETREKYNQALRNYFKEHLDEMCCDCKERFNTNVLRILDCKVESDRKIIENAPKICDFLNDKSKDNLDKILKKLKDTDIKFEYDPTLVRGLDYYSDVVFEFHFIGKSGTNYGAICGGGHYNSLVEELGGPKGVEGCGLAFGLERLVSLLSEIDERFNNLKPEIDVIMMAEDSSLNDLVFDSSYFLRMNEVSVNTVFEKKSLKSFLKKADKVNAKLACVIKNEYFAFIKNLETKEQIDVEVKDIGKKIIEMIEDIRFDKQMEIEDLEDENREDNEEKYFGEDDDIFDKGDDE